MPDTDILDRIQVDPSRDEPVYAQLRNGLRREIHKGRLREGDRLPTVQAVARRYGVSTKTVMQAFGDLADDGVISTRRGRRGVVSERRGPSTEVLLFIEPKLLAQERFALFFHQIVEGLAEEYGNPERRFWTTVFGAVGRTSAAEMLSVCAVRRCDGVVAYRPPAEVLPLIRGLAARIPVCTLFHPVSGAADCVVVDPVKPLRRLLRERLAQGKRRFAFVGIAHDAPNPFGGSSPHAAIRRETHRVLAAARIKCAEYLRPMIAGNRAPFIQVFRSLPAGTVVIADVPYLIDGVDFRGRALDFITYTESRQTLEMFQGSVDLLYAGLERVGCAAARALRARAEDAPSAGRIQRMEPEIVRHRRNPAG